jgi:ribonuclease HII
MKPTLIEERRLWKKGIKYVLGVDEVGRGAFAGPIVAGAVVFPKLLKITKKLESLKEINDSKMLNPVTRRRLAKLVKKHALFWSVEEVDISIINKHGIGYANKMVFRKVIKKVLEQIREDNFYLLSDGHRTKYIRKFSPKNHKAIIDGDKKSLTIAAASIIAKVHRDGLMRKLARDYKHYKFARNKGYGTKEHQEALKKYGLSEIHRKSFSLVKFLSS